MGEVFEKLLARPQARAQQVDVGVITRHALGKPEGRRVIFARVVEGTERQRPEPLHVPDVKEFMSGSLQGLARAGRVERPAHNDLSGIQVLHAVPRRDVRREMKEKSVVIEIRGGHHGHLRAHDFPQTRFQFPPPSRRL